MLDGRSNERSSTTTCERARTFEFPQAARGDANRGDTRTVPRETLRPFSAPTGPRECSNESWPDSKARRSLGDSNDPPSGAMATPPKPRPILVTSARRPRRAQRPERPTRSNEGGRPRPNNPSLATVRDSCDCAPRTRRRSDVPRCAKRMPDVIGQPHGLRTTLGLTDGSCPELTPPTRRQSSSAPPFDGGHSRESKSDVLQTTSMPDAARCSCSSFLRVIRRSSFARPSNVRAYPLARTRPPAPVGWSALLGCSSSSSCLVRIVRRRRSVRQVGGALALRIVAP